MYQSVPELRLPRDGMVRTMRMTAQDCQYVCMPLFHAMGLLLQVLSALIAGSRVYCVERFSPNRWLEDVRKSGSTVTNALGVMPEFIFRTPESEFDRDHKLRTIMAVPVATEWGEAFEERFNIKFMQCYGMTEVNIICYTRDDDPLLPGMAGHVLDEFFEVRVVDPETDEVLPEGEIGEIVVRPKVPFCFGQGYFRLPERTVKAWRNLWFHTSDAGYFDEEGRLFYADRIKDRIRRHPRVEEKIARQVAAEMGVGDAVGEGEGLPPGAGMGGGGGMGAGGAGIMPPDAGEAASLDGRALTPDALEPRQLRLGGG